MAEHTSEQERVYTIPLKRAKHSKRSKRADRAVGDIRNFLTRHLKTDHIWIDNEVNEAVWSRGKFKIPSRIRVRATRFEDGVVEVTLPDAEAEGSLRDIIQERREKAAESPVLKPMGEEEEEESPNAGLPVTELEGLGPATAEKLEQIEITTIGELAAASPEAVAEAVSKDQEGVQPWIDAAKELMEAGAPALKPMGEEENPNADLPVTELEGLGPATAEKLEEVEITTIGELAAASPEVVAEAVGKGQDGVQPWIDAAKELMEAGAPVEDSEEVEETAREESGGDTAGEGADPDTEAGEISDGVLDADDSEE